MIVACRGGLTGAAGNCNHRRNGRCNITAIYGAMDLPAQSDHDKGWASCDYVVSKAGWDGCAQCLAVSASAAPSLCLFKRRIVLKISEDPVLGRPSPKSGSRIWGHAPGRRAGPHGRQGHGECQCPVPRLLAQPQLSPDDECGTVPRSTDVVLLDPLDEAGW